MNETLGSLINAYAGDTGLALLYYDFENTGGSGVLNTSPASTVGSYTGFLVRNEAVENSYLNPTSGFDIRIDYLRFGPFAQDLVNKDAKDTELTFLFSFEKKEKVEGVLFGSLVRDDFSYQGEDYHFGRGFNIGVNSRNKVFFQGIDSINGEYCLPANGIEMGNRNICSVSVTPYSVTMARYDLKDDSFEEETVYTNSQITNGLSTEEYFLGGSPTFLRQGHSFSGYMDQFLVLSGFHTATDLKAIASGFVATGVVASGQSFSDTVITGQDITIIEQSGVTGYEPFLTGYLQSRSESNLIEFTLVENVTPFAVDDGARFITGYSLPSSMGDYIEETSFLFPNNDYSPTGADAFATLGLQASGELVTRYTVSSLRTITTTGVVPLYEFRPITGTLEGGTGYLKSYLTEEVSRTGSLAENLSFKDGVIELYDRDFLYYLSERV